MLNGIVSINFLDWLCENHSDIIDSVTDSWGINKSGRLFKLPGDKQPGGEEEEEGDHGGSFARAFQIALEEHRAKERVIDLTEKLLEEILSLGSLPVFPDDHYLKFNWISFIALCRCVLMTDKSSLDDDDEQQQQQELLQDLATQSRTLYRSVDTQVIGLVSDQAEALVPVLPEAAWVINVFEIEKVMEAPGLNGVQDYLRLEMSEKGDNEGIAEFLMERLRAVEKVGEMAMALREAVLALDEGVF